MDVIRLPEAGDFILGLRWIPKTSIKSLPKLKRVLTGFVDKGPILYYRETVTHMGVPIYLKHPTIPPLSTSLDLRLPGEPLTVGKDLVTRFLDADQERLWVEIEKADHGVLVVPGGRGKTVLAIKKMMQVRRHTIIFVNRDMLLGQWVERLKECAGLTDDQVGIVQEKTWQTDRQVVVASIPSLANRKQAITAGMRDRFGFVIFDEVHHAPAPETNAIVSVFRGRRLGLTATPTRWDGLQTMMFAHMGRVIVTSDYSPITPLVRVRNMPNYQLTEEELRDRSGMFSHAKLWKRLGRIKDRNLRLAADIRWYQAQDRTILVLGNCVEHLMRMHDVFPNGGILHEKVKKKDRPGQMARPLVFATYGMAAEALDKPTWDALVLAMPTGSDARFLQAVFRILRVHEAKISAECLIYRDTFYRCQTKVDKMLGYARGKGWAVEEDQSGMELLQKMSPRGDSDESGVWGRLSLPQDRDRGNGPGGE